MTLQFVNGYVTGFGLEGRDPREGRPVTAWDAVLVPIGDGAAVGVETVTLCQGGWSAEGLKNFRRSKGWGMNHIASMPDNLACRQAVCARPTGEHRASLSGTLSAMRKKPKKPPSGLQIAVAARLQAVQDELKRDDTRMGKLIGVGRTTWGNWVKQENMPEEEAMIRLCEKANVKYEWLYLGEGERMPLGLLIRLEMRIAGIDPDKATSDERAIIAARVAARSAA